VTVCIAAIDPTLETIVTVSDTMLSNEFASADLSTVKFQPLNQHLRWFAMYSDNPSTFTAVHRHAERLLSHTSRASVDEVKSAIKYGYLMEIETMVADTLRFCATRTRQDFEARGLQMLGESTFERKHKELEELKLDLDLLVFGFDDARLPHLFSVDGTGKCFEHAADRIGIIGAGKFTALEVLNIRREHTSATTTEDAVLELCEAKFFAERVPFVGQSTFVFILHSDGRRQWMFGEPTRKLKKLWLRRVTQKPSRSAREIVRTGLKDWSY
jgi:predicted ABC-type ATPase